ncbi:MAG TPA: hypothetical protein VMW79_10925 [Anaerolineae bacterium]|nr:hypothetical protein [Anaerolineae bacterium]
MPAVKGITDLRQIQICFQTNCATPGTVTARLIGTCGIDRETGRVLPTNPIGLMSKNIIGRAYDTYYSGVGPLATGEDGLTFQQIIWWLSMGTVGGVVPVPAAPVYTWTFAPDLDDGDLPDVAHLIYGDNAAEWEGTCGFGTQTKISAAFKAPWQIEMDTIWQNWDNAGVAFETIAYPTPLDTILGQMTTFALDTTCLFGATPTVRECALIDWTLTIPGFHPKYFQDGTMYYNCYGLASRALSFDFTLEFDDLLTKAIVWDAYRDGTPLYVQLVATGGVIPGDSGTNYSVTINMCLEIKDANPLDTRDGNDIQKFTAETVYDVDCADCVEWEIIVVNGESTLPACT